ncbi:hypothetical protein Q5P01_013615 [Channa striata]|uniref:Ig-like domain-containing protein n=1 Tax=Channa striata TaxID=64152 RepID=A0AA88MMQ2_CHASR|nr:hypothetical protein Q5P01_013615 [Channa striata]
MARRWFLVFFIVTFSLVSGEPPIYGIKGLQVTVKTQVFERPDSILWKHNGNKVVEFDGKQEDVYGSFFGRVTLDWVSAELSIKKLTYEDSGEYELEVYKNNNFQQLRYNVEVIDKVTKPTVSCKMSNSGTSNTDGNQAMLNCFAESRQPPPLKFEYLISNGETVPGPKLEITLGGAYDNEEYKCVVSNPLTNETATFTAKDCYPDKSSYVPLIAGLSVAFGICVLAAVLALVFCIKKLRSHKERLQREESNALLHKTPTIPSAQRLVPQKNKNMNPEENHTNDIDSCQDDTDEKPQKGAVGKLIAQFDRSTKFQQTLPTDTPTGTVGKLIAQFNRSTKIQQTLPTDTPTGAVRKRISEFEPISNVQDLPTDTPTEPEKDADEEEEAQSPPENSCLLSRQKKTNTTDEVNTGADSYQVTCETGDKGEETTCVQDPNLPPEETRTTENDNEEGNTSVSEDESPHDTEPINERNNLPLIAPRNRKIPQKPDNINTDVHKEDIHNAHDDKSGETTCAQNPNLPPEEIRTTENDQKERDTSVSEDSNESAHDTEPINERNNLPLIAPRNRKIPQKPDNINTDVHKEDIHNAHDDKSGETTCAQNPNLPPEEILTTENDHEDGDTSVSEDESAHDTEPINERNNLPLIAPQNPQIPQKPDNINTDVYKEDLNNAHDDKSGETTCAQNPNLPPEEILTTENDHEDGDTSVSEDESAHDTEP